MSTPRRWIDLMDSAVVRRKGQIMGARPSTRASTALLRRRTLALALAGSAAALTVGVLPAAAGSAKAAALHQLDQRGAHHGGATTSNLIDHGGEVLPASDVYVVWWGNPGAWFTDVVPGIETFFQGFDYNGSLSSYVNTATQYMRYNKVTVTYEGYRVDTSSPPNKPSPNVIAAEATKEWPTVDANGVYFVFTSNFPKGGNYCAWHSYGNVDGVTDAVAYMPNTTNVAGCDPGNLYSLSGSEGLRSLANVSAHEFMESITDALISAWYDSSGQEIGDKCAWRFAGAVTLSNGSEWQLQEEWSNAASGCVQTSP